jgi:hypothetical protein
MATYSNTNLPQLLKIGDMVDFHFKGKNSRYEVRGDFLHDVSWKSNRAIIISLGITDSECGTKSDDKVYKFFESVTGKKPNVGYWPAHTDMNAQTKFVLALFSIINGAKVEDFMPKADPKAAPAPKPKTKAAIEAALKAGNWGCQKTSVYKLISAITGFEFKP